MATNNLVSLNLNTISYFEFLNSFTIYPSMSKCKKPNYEAHHIVPISIQKNNGITKDGPLFDDRCIRLTAFEHILIHYLAARDLGGDYIKIFYCMVCRNLNKISDINQVTLENLNEWANLRELGRIKSAESNKGHVPWNKGVPCSEEVKEKLRKANLGKKHTEETKEKCRQAMLGKKFSKESIQKRKETRLKNGGYKLSEEAKEKIRLARAKQDMSFLRGRKQSKETIEKVRAALLGRKPSIEEIGKNRQIQLKRMKPIKEKYQEYKNNGYSGTWNDFQKLYKTL